MFFSTRFQKARGCNYEIPRLSQNKMKRLYSWTIQKYVLPHEFPSVQKHVLKGVRLKCTQFLSKAVATHALFLLALVNRHPQSCSAAEVEGSCTCSQVSPIYAACCKKFNSINILQQCPSDFVAESTSGHTHATFWSGQSLQHQKEVSYQ